MENGSLVKSESRDNMRIKRVFVHEAGEYVGPFDSRADAERFVALIERFSGSREGISIVERSVETIPRQRKSLASSTPIGFLQHCSK
jgi:hypothetical protein